MTSMGEMSAARMTSECGCEVVVAMADLRRDLTTSFTPRLRAWDFAAILDRAGAGGFVSVWEFVCFFFDLGRD